MTLPFTLPDWVPWWVSLVVLVPVILLGLAFLFMPFSVFGLKGGWRGSRRGWTRSRAKSAAWRCACRNGWSGMSATRVRMGHRRGAGRWMSRNRAGSRATNCSRGRPPRRRSPAGSRRRSTRRSRLRPPAAISRTGRRRRPTARSTRPAAAAPNPASGPVESAGPPRCPPTRPLPYPRRIRLPASPSSPPRPCWRRKAAPGS